MKKLSSNFFLGVILTCILTFLFFIPYLLKGKVPIPADAIIGLYHPWRDIALAGYNPQKFPIKNPLITDSVLQTYPWRFLALSDLKNGNLPLWNPYSFSGQPLLGNIQSAVFQALNVFFFTFPFKIAWSVQIILPVILTSLFMFLFINQGLKLKVAASLFGAFVLPFTGFYIAWLTWGTVITTVMWLPLILLSINKLFTRQSTWWFVVLVFSASQTIFSGHWQSALYIFLVIILYIGYISRGAKIAKSSILIIAGLALGILVTALQLFPSIEFIKLSARTIDQGYYPGRTDWFLPLQHFIQLISPDFFGNPSTYNYWGVWNYGEFVSFIGIIPLGLALFGALKKFHQSLFFIIISFLSLLVAIENPVSKIPYIFNFPLISSMQPSRSILLLDFSLTVLAAFGLDQFLKEKSKKIFLPFIFILIPLVLLLVATYTQKDYFPIVGNLDTAHIAFRNLIFPLISATFLFIVILFRFLNIPKKLLIFIIFATTSIELFRFGFKFLPFSEISWIFPSTQTTSYLASQEKPFRILSTDRRLMHPNISGVYGLESVDGYDPLYLAKYNQLVSAWQTQNPKTTPASFNRIVTPQKYDSKLADFLNVKYVLSLNDLDNPNFVKVYEEGETKIYENKKVLPRAFFVQEVTRTQDDSEELSKLLDKDFDITKVATSQEFNFTKQPVSASLEFKKYSSQSLSLEVKTQNDAPLILSNVFYPGWQAYLDNQKISIYKVNYMFQAIIVPKGQHFIEFKFRPKSFYNGLYISISATLATFLIALFLWKRNYR